MEITSQEGGNPKNTIPICSSNENTNASPNVRSNKRDAFQELASMTTAKKCKTTNDTIKNDDDDEEKKVKEKVVQELPHTPTTTNGTDDDDDATTKPTTTSATATKRSSGESKTAATLYNNSNDNDTDVSHTMTSSNDDTTAELTITTTATASKKKNKKIISAPPMKKDKHIADNSMRIITPTLNTKNSQGRDQALPLTPPASASASASGSEEPPRQPIDDEADSLKGHTDEEWFSLMGWHFSENKDHDFVDKDGKLYNYENHFDRFEFVQDKIQSLVYDRLKNKYGFEQIAVAQNKGTSAPGGGDHHRFPRIFISSGARTKSTMLVLVPKMGGESPGQWDKDLFTTGEKGNFLFASQFPYIDMALEQGWGVVLCDPNGGDVYDSDEYREAHVQYVWDDIIQPSEATCVMYVAFGEGTDAVLSILDSSRAAEFRERVKAAVLLDGTTGDKRKEKLDRTWLNKHARSFMAKNGSPPGRNGIKVNAAEEHELVPGFAMQAVFSFLRSQHGLFTKTRTSAQSGSKSASSTKGSTNAGSRGVGHDRRVIRLQSGKANRVNNKGINTMMNTKTAATAAKITTSSGGPRRGRGRPRKHG